MASRHSEEIFCGTRFFHGYLGGTFSAYSVDSVVQFGIFWASLSLAQASDAKSPFSDGFSVSKVLEDLFGIFVVELSQCICQSVA